VYTVSLVLLLAAVATLYLGFRAGNLVFVFASIAASVLSMLFLGVSVLRRRAVEEGNAAMSAWTAARPDEETPAAHDVPEDEPVPLDDEG
jgi:hypothetical protein